jgi:hypothetical protein
LRIENLQEGVKLEGDKPNHHFQSLRGLLHNPPKGKLYESLKDANKMNEQVLHYRRYLREVHTVDGKTVAKVAKKSSKKKGGKKK